MQVQVEIGFEQLLQIVKALPSGKLKRLKLEIEKEVNQEESRLDLETLLMNGPVATIEELEVIGKNRKAINQWRAN